MQVKEIVGYEDCIWLGYASHENGTLHFFGDSEGRIVHGLLAVLLTVVEGKTAVELLVCTLMALSGELGLRAQLSASCNQGLHALSEAILEAIQRAG